MSACTGSTIGRWVDDALQSVGRNTLTGESYQKSRQRFELGTFWKEVSSFTYKTDSHASTNISLDQ